MPPRSAVASVGYFLPEQVVTTEEVCRRIREATGFKVASKLVERLTGVRQRHYRSENEQSSDLAVQAALQALERAQISADQIDLIVFAACTQDITEPATANIVQEKLGATHAQVLDVKNACNSFLNGMDVADSHIRAGKSRRALVVAGETLSLGIDWDIHSLDDLRSRLAALTLGDAGAAVVMEPISAEENRGILTTRFRSYGDRWRLATVLGGGSLHHLDQRHSFFVSESSSLREAAYDLIPDEVHDVFESIGWEPGDVEVGCGHQVTSELVNGLAKRIGIPPERSVVSITDCGNTAAATIPLCLGRAYDQGKLKRGTKILLVGGAAGFSVGVIPLIW